MKKLRNNQGLTLVELMVAVAILVIVVLPLLYSFITSTNLNSKAKKKNYATLVAQNIIEGLEGQSVKNIAEQVANNSFTAFNINSGTIKEVEEDAGSYVEVTDHVEKDSYSYVIENYSIPGSDKKYNALLTIDAKDGDAGYDEVNDVELAHLTALNTKYDAICSKSIIFNNLKSDILTQLSENVDERDLERTITVDIEKVSDTTKVTVSYKYKIMRNNTVFPVNNNDYSYVVFNNASHPTDSLNNVYLFFDPWNTSTQSHLLGRTDRIIINNKDEIPCNIYLVKQDDISTTQNYKCTVTYNDSQASKASAGQTVNPAVDIYTNLNLNRTVGRQVSFTYNDVVLDQNAVEAIIDIAPIGGGKTSNRKFDVSVEVYPNGTDLGSMTAGERIVKLTGGMIN